MWGGREVFTHKIHINRVTKMNNEQRATQNRRMWLKYTIIDYHSVLRAAEKQKLSINPNNLFWATITSTKWSDEAEPKKKKREEKMLRTEAAAAFWAPHDSREPEITRDAVSRYKLPADTARSAQSDKLLALMNVSTINKYLSIDIPFHVGISHLSVRCPMLSVRSIQLGCF